MMDGWRSVTIGDVCQTGAGGTPLKSREDYYQDGTIPWLLSGAVSQGEIFESNTFITQQGLDNSSAKMFPVNTVLVAMYGATAGQIGILRFEAATNQAVCGIMPNDVYVPEFLYYGMLSRKNELIAKAAGNAQPNISQAKIRKTRLPLPPKPEQKRIVAILDEVFAGIDKAVANTDKNLANARELFDSHLNDVFSQEGEGWSKKSVRELVTQAIIAKPLDGNHGEIHPKKADFVDQGVPFVMASDLKVGEVDQLNCHFISPDQADSLRKGFAKNGDVLLSHKGTIGRVAVLHTTHDYVMLTPQVTYYRIQDDSVLSSIFLYYFMQTPGFQDEMKQIAGIGATRAYIGITKQMDLHICYPGVEVQERIVSSCDLLVSQIHQLESIFQRKLDFLTELKQSILQKAFSGELTNIDEITDEPVMRGGHDTENGIPIVNRSRS